MQLHKSGYIIYSSSVSQSLFDVTESISYQKTLLDYGNFLNSFEYDGTEYTAYAGLLVLDTKGTSERANVLSIDLAYDITGSTTNYRSKTLPAGVENKIKIVKYSGDLESSSAYNIISSSFQGEVVGEIDLDDYYNYTTGSNNYQAGTLFNSGSFTLNISSSALNRYGYTNLVAYVDHLYQKKDFNEKETYYNAYNIDENTNLLTPITVPSIASESQDIAISYDGKFVMTVGGSSGDYILISGSDDNYVIMENIGDITTDGGSPYSVDFSPTGYYLAHNSTVGDKLRFYYYDGVSFSRINSPTTFPSQTSAFVRFSKTGEYIALSATTSPYVWLYHINYDNGSTVLTKLTDVDIAPVGQPLLRDSLDFSHDDAYMVVGHQTSPYITIYSGSGSGTGRLYTKLSDPDSLPTGFGTGIAFNNDSTFLSVVHANPPYITTYYNNNGSFIKLNDPNTIMTSIGNNAIYHPQQNIIFCSGQIGSFNTRTPGYYINGDDHTAEYITLPNPQSGNALNSKGVDVSVDGKYVFYSTDAVSSYIAFFKSQEITGNYTQTIISASDLGEYTIVSQSIPADTYKKILEPTTTGKITFSSSLSSSVYNADNGLSYSRSLGEIVSSVEIDSGEYFSNVGFASFDVPQYKTGNTTFTASINIIFNQNAHITRSNVLPDTVENKLYIVKYSGSVLTDNPYSIISSSFQLPTESIVNTVDLDNYFTYVTSSDSNVASASNIGYYTTSIIIPTESLSYGEQNDFLIYTDMFKKKQDFVNQVDGYDVGTGITRLTDPSTQYSNSGTFYQTICMSDDASFIVRGNNNLSAPYLLIYKKNEDDTYSYLTNQPTTSHPNYVRGRIDISSGSNYIVATRDNAPYVYFYKNNGDDTFTRISHTGNNPGNLPYGGRFSRSTTYACVTSAQTPFIRIYKRTGDAFASLAQPNTPPSTAITDCDFSDNDTYLVVAATNGNAFNIYSRSGDTFTKLTDPSTYPGVGVRCVKFSTDGDYLMFGGSFSGKTQVYSNNRNGTFTLLSGTGISVGQDVNEIRFTSNDSNVIIATDNSVDVYTNNFNGTFTLNYTHSMDNPVMGIGISSDATYLSTYHQNSTPTPVFRILKSDSVTLNKTSFRLNPQIELEIDVNYPIGVLGNSQGTPYNNIAYIDGINKRNIAKVNNVEK